LRPVVRGMVWILLLLTSVAAVWADATAWTRSCRFSVEVDGGKSPDGVVFEQRGTPNLMGQLPDGAWFLLMPPQRKVVLLDPNQVQVSQDGRGVLMSGAIPVEKARGVKFGPGEITFDLATHWLVVRPMPDLLGEVNAEDFLELCPDFQDREEAYQPQADPVQQIAKVNGKVTVEVFFGSWCPHCQQVLPRLIKSLRMADNSNLEIKWIGLPRTFGNEPEVKARDVKGVPTVIVFREGQEVGRFSGTESVPVEESLAKLVQSG
jgi:thiol-disulfide isomerase/thioredoxin